LFPYTTLFRSTLSGFGLAGVGIEQAYSRHLPCVHQIPMNTHPNDEKFGSSLWRDGKVFRMSNWQRLAISEMQLESAEGRSAAHFLEIRDFHVRDSIVNRLRGLF